MDSFEINFFGRQWILTVSSIIDCTLKQWWLLPSRLGVH